jgi:preprotein translocase subunit YajC
MSQMLLMLPIFGIMYFLLIRPQQVKAKEHRKMVSRLKVGDRIVTSGGIHGQISGVKDDTVLLTVADKVEIEVMRSAIGVVLTEENETGDRNGR